MSRWKLDIAAIIACLAAMGVLFAAPARAQSVDPPAAADLLPHRYARAWQAPVSVYATPGDPATMEPKQVLLPPDSWVSILEEVELDGQLWYRIEGDAYVLARDLLSATPSEFHGLFAPDGLGHPVGFVIADRLNVRARPGATDDNPPLRSVPRYAALDILGQGEAADGLWYQVGPDEYVHGDFVRVANLVSRPPEVPPEDRWIAVDLAQQALTAYEGDRPVFATLVASGRPPWYTPTGLFRIWIKLQAGQMQGGTVEEGDLYYLQDVPWIMYFSRDVGLHAAYWHDRFGTPRSHGCVNLSPLDAKWFFDWATPLLPFPDSKYVYASRHNPGTWVYVYSSN